MPWVRVSRAAACPVCGRPDWCQASEDGAVVMCMRVPSECSKVDATGATYYLHHQEGADAAAEGATDAPSGTGELAPEGARDRIYRMIINKLSLREEHRADLRRRGLSDLTIRARGYVSWPAFAQRSRLVRELDGRGVDLTTVPGFYRGPRGLALAGSPDCYGIPCRDAAGRIIGMQLRHDRSGPEAGPKYVFLSSAKHEGASPGYLTHVPLHAGPTEEVRITEGFLKADVATALGGMLTIGMASCSAHRQLPAILQALGARRVVVAPDADCRSNRLVAQGLLSTVAALQGAGFEVMIEGWPPGAGKGIDDVLSAGRAGEITRYAGAQVAAALRSIAAQAGVVVPGAVAELGAAQHISR